MGTNVTLPPSLIYPVEVVEVLVSVGQQVKRGQRLLKLKYWNDVSDGVVEEGTEEPPLVTREFYAHFESPHYGVLSELLVKLSTRIADQQFVVAVVDEGCDHSVQYGGLCALCGRTVDQKDYMGYSDSSRAPIAMSHDTSGLTVSRQEAVRIESRSVQRLLKDRRLVLVVDLDQTVIHASVSPEIGRWIADPESPNHELVNDVRSFALRERPPGHHDAAGGAHPPRGDQENWYYVKLRPGLHEFLEAMAPKYEMHVYTMATKRYALQVTKAIDPTGKYFADRILSRDASGSLVHKDLRRLFPVSTQMVTIIDDRGDVWNWSPHLVRCVPYHFWTGTGDINSSFLPKRSGLITPSDDESNERSDSITAGDHDSDDHELANVGKALEKLHHQFYEVVGAMPAKDQENDAKLPDVGKLLPTLKSKVFDGCVLLFSGFFPLSGTTDLDNADIVQWVRSFGAVVVGDFLPSVTHLVARNAGTVKARQAAGQNKHVVKIEWVFECLDKWQCVDEKPYLLDVPNPIKTKIEAPPDEDVNPSATDGFVRSLQSGDVDWSLDEELEELLGDDDDEEDVEVKEEDKEKEDKTDIIDGQVVPEAESVETETAEAETTNTDGKAAAKRKREESDLELDLDEDWD